MEERLARQLARRTLVRVRPDRDTLHDLAGVHKLRPVRPLLLHRPGRGDDYALRSDEALSVGRAVHKQSELSLG